MSNKVIKQWSMVRPADETPRRSLWLSCLDLAASRCHRGTIYVYSPNNNNNNSGSFLDADVLKESLGRALVPFYPMAGRLKEGHNDGRIEIDCNAEGALFVEAETTHSLVDFGDFKPTPQLIGLVVPSWSDFSSSSEEYKHSFPLAMVQLTKFSCGGVTLGFAFHHTVGDGQAWLHFVNSWARLARGLQLELAPFHDRTPYLQSRNPPRIHFHRLEHNPSQGYPTTDEFVPIANSEEEIAMPSYFRITNDQITALKKKATNSSELMNCDNIPSTYVSLAAHILIAACKARGVADDQEVKLMMPLDGRARLKNPALPQGFSGNASFMAVYSANSGEILHNPLWYVASKIHETLKTMSDEEYLRSGIDYLETHPNRTSGGRGAHTYKRPNLAVNSWLRLPFYEADFGWGKPSIVGHGGRFFEGQVYLIPTQDKEDGIIVMIVLLTQHMVLFEKYLYEF